ncbi:MAG: hypothetical protein BWY09_01117 [Candidatus Hydrogenedentes bacterium ADurb.Bin179]|nr:MAG: hypothetical protein BWY09_01117 [Candidatus Hydrogenedentes bacterium ADurb.Bin179]
MTGSGSGRTGGGATGAGSGSGSIGGGATGAGSGSGSIGGGATGTGSGSGSIGGGATGSGTMATRLGRSGFGTSGARGGTSCSTFSGGETVVLSGCALWAAAAPSLFRALASFAFTGIE